MATREGLSLEQVACYVPFRKGIAWQDLCSKCFGYPEDVLLVLLCVVCAGAVNHDSSGFEAFPDVGYDVLLASCTHLHILGAPFLDGVVVFTEHSFTAAWNVAEDEAELFLAELAEIGCLIIGDDCLDGVLVALRRNYPLPFADVLGKYVCAFVIDFVGNECRTFWQVREEKG